MVKLSSARIILADSLVTSAPAMPMATPISAALPADGVIDAVAGHGHNLMGLKGVCNPGFVFGCQPCIGRDRRDGLSQPVLMPALCACATACQTSVQGGSMTPNHSCPDQTGFQGFASFHSHIRR